MIDKHLSTIHNLSWNYYSFLKMLCSSVTRAVTKSLTWIEIQYAVRRNFGGLENIQPIQVFEDELRSQSDLEVMFLKLLDNLFWKQLRIYEVYTRY